MASSPLPREPRPPEMPVLSPRSIAALVLLSLAALAPGWARAQAIVLGPFGFDSPPGFARVSGTAAATVLRDGDGNELSAEAYPGPHPLAGLAPDALAATLGDTLRSSLAPAGYGWLEPPHAERRADGITVFRALAARPEPRGGQGFQFVLYAIAPMATLHVAYAGIGGEAGARAATGAVARSLRLVAP